MRLYLDTNILTKLADHPALQQVLEQYEPYLNLIYSEANIDDLSRSTNKEKTKADLETIRDLTHSQCIAKYFKQEQVTYEKRDPLEFYQTSLDHSFSPENLGQLDDLLKGIDFKALGIEDPVLMLNDAIKGLKETVLDNLSTPEYDYSSLFKSSLENPTMKSLVSDMINLINGSPESKAFYLHARALMDKHVEQRKELSNQQEPIQHLNNVLPSSAMGKSFEEFTEMALNIGKTHFNDQGEKEKFISRYSNLDLLGFRADSKMSVQNINTDATHAYFAAHCDVFITQDKKLSAKAEVLYREIGTETMIMDVNEACQRIPSLIPKTDNQAELVKEITGHNELPVRDYYSEVENRCTTIVRLLDNFLLGFFDENLHHNYPNNDFITVYYKAMPTLNRWYYQREYELVTNKLVSILGLDNYGNVDFADWSTEFQNEKNTWRGRYWGNNNGIILKQTDEFGITLFVTNTA